MVRSSWQNMMAVGLSGTSLLLATACSTGEPARITAEPSPELVTVSDQAQEQAEQATRQRRQREAERLADQNLADQNLADQNRFDPQGRDRLAQQNFSSEPSPALAGGFLRPLGEPDPSRPIQVTPTVPDRPRPVQNVVPSGKPKGWQGWNRPACGRG